MACWHVQSAQDLEPLALPDENAWASIGVVCGPEIHAGHQSRIFHADVRGERCVVKLTDGRLVDESFHRRVEVVASLAETNTSVVGPVPIGSDVATALGDWLVVAYPAVVGRVPDVTRATGRRAMASTLAGLHDSLSQLGVGGLPPVATLRGPDSGTALWVQPTAAAPRRLLRLEPLLAGDRIWVFDFDDCGYGPVEFDIGNTLYMVLFDSWMSDDLPRFERFRGWFVDGYRSASGQAVTDATLEYAIRLRVDALGRWIEHPEESPIGIRTATPAWRDSLRAFVESRPVG